MPSSTTEGKADTKAWASQTKIEYNNILDIGVGEGTYYNLLSSLDNLQECKWTGVEAWEPYIDKYNLKNKYHNIIHDDVRKVVFNDDKYDLVFCGDVLEHMTKEDAIKLIDTLLPISKYIYISIPIIYHPQGAYAGNPFEVHVKEDWSSKEVLETFPNIEDYKEYSVVGIYKLKGLA